MSCEECGGAIVIYRDLPLVSGVPETVINNLDFSNEENSGYIPYI